MNGEKQMNTGKNVRVKHTVESKRKDIGTVEIHAEKAEAIRNSRSQTPSKGDGIKIVMEIESLKK